MSTTSTAPHEFVIRHGRVSDIEAILTLADASPTAARWSRAEYATGCVSFDPSERLVKALFVASNPASRTVFGFAAFTAVPLAAEYELANMAVAEDCQRRGIGTRLIAAGLLWCRSWGPAALSAGPARNGEADASRPLPQLDLWLEVRSSNRGAVAFYEQAGFRAVGMRAGYYAQPTEDAILMRQPLADRPIGGKLPQQSG